jgi:hypothetical protein
MRNKAIAEKHLEKLDTCHTRMRQLLEDWYAGKNEISIDEALRYLTECERTMEYLSDVIGLEVED